MRGCAAPGGLLLARQGEVGWRAHAWQAALTVVSEAGGGLAFLRPAPKDMLVQHMLVPWSH